jgi:hypothetical protein
MKDTSHSIGVEAENIGVEAEKFVPHVWTTKGQMELVV